MIYFCVQHGIVCIPYIYIHTTNWDVFSKPPRLSSGLDQVFFCGAKKQFPEDSWILQPFEQFQEPQLDDICFFVINLNNYFEGFPTIVPVKESLRLSNRNPHLTRYKQVLTLFDTDFSPLVHPTIPCTYHDPRLQLKISTAWHFHCHVGDHLSNCR